MGRRGSGSPRCHEGQAGGAGRRLLDGRGLCSEHALGRQTRCVVLRGDASSSLRTPLPVCISEFPRSGHLWELLSLCCTVLEQRRQPRWPRTRAVRAAASLLLKQLPVPQKAHVPTRELAGRQQRGCTRPRRPRPHVARGRSWDPRIGGAASVSRRR